MEFLIGRTLVNNIINLGVEQFVRDDLQSDPRQDWTEVIETEPDAGLGNGGLGRLAACFIDSLATLQIPAMGYGLRYEYGIFRQAIENGFQVEHPDHWLASPTPGKWPGRGKRSRCRSAAPSSWRTASCAPSPATPSHLLGVPYDRPVVGYGGRTINTLRLWGAASPDFFDFGEFSSGDFVGAIVEPSARRDRHARPLPRRFHRRRPGAALRPGVLPGLLLAADIVARFRRTNADWRALPDKVAIQLNDTHPAMAVAELMRILLDQAKLGWDEAWDLTVRTLAYTNHTLLPEALEKWPVRFFELVCPRLLEIIYEINRRFLDDVQQRYPGDEDRVRRMSLIEEKPAPPGAHGQPGHRRHAQHQRRGRRSTPTCCAPASSPTSPSCSPSGSTTRPTA